jgi:hypothetical protein
MVLLGLHWGKRWVAAVEGRERALPRREGLHVNLSRDTTMTKSVRASSHKLHTSQFCTRKGEDQLSPRSLSLTQLTLPSIHVARQGIQLHRKLEAPVVIAPKARLYNLT